MESFFWYRRRAPREITSPSRHRSLGALRRRDGAKSISVRFMESQGRSKCSTGPVVLARLIVPVSETGGNDRIKFREKHQGSCQIAAQVPSADIHQR